MNEIERRAMWVWWELEQARLWLLTVPHLWCAITLLVWRLLPVCWRYEQQQAVQHDRFLSYGRVILNLAYAFDAAGSELTKLDDPNAKHPGPLTLE